MPTCVNGEKRTLVLLSPLYLHIEEKDHCAAASLYSSCSSRVGGCYDVSFFPFEFNALPPPSPPLFARDTNGASIVREEEKE